jgi:hypothetical protein
LWKLLENLWRYIQSRVKSKPSLTPPKIQIDQT